MDYVSSLCFFVVLNGRAPGLAEVSAQPLASLGAVELEVPVPGDSQEPLPGWRVVDPSHAILNYASRFNCLI